MLRKVSICLPSNMVVHIETVVLCCVASFKCPKFIIYVEIAGSAPKRLESLDG